MAVKLTSSLANRSFLTLSLALLSAPTLVGCGSDEPVFGGATVLDSGMDGTADTDGEGNGGSGGTGNGGRPGTDTGGASNMPSEDTSFVGRTCLSDNDCPGDLTCLTSESTDFLGGGPAHGYCTAVCGSDLDCVAYDSTAICLAVSDTTSYCIQSCTPGQAGSLGSTKCQDRLDVACESLQGLNFCRPVCGSDADCCSEAAGDDCSSRSNVYCDLGSGVCVDAEPEGLPIGAECDPNADDSGCAYGLCLPFSDTYAVCSAVCTVGTIGCGNDTLTPEDPGEPICLNAYGLDSGDVGACNQRCNCDLDCNHKDALCFGGPFGDQPNGETVFGTQGLCVAPSFADQAQPGDIFGIECTDRDAGVSKRDSGTVSSDSGVTDSGSSMMSMEPDTQPDATTTPPSEAGSPMTQDASSDGG